MMKMVMIDIMIIELLESFRTGLESVTKFS